MFVCTCIQLTCSNVCLCVHVYNLLVVMARMRSAEGDDMEANNIARTSLITSMAGFIVALAVIIVTLSLVYTGPYYNSTCFCRDVFNVVGYRPCNRCYWMTGGINISLMALVLRADRVHQYALMMTHDDSWWLMMTHDNSSVIVYLFIYKTCLLVRLEFWIWFVSMHGLCTSELSNQL